MVLIGYKNNEHTTRTMHGKKLTTIFYLNAGYSLKLNS